jgi:hypothetical protein
MIVRCNALCRKSDGFTDAALDVDSDQVICGECGDAIKDISEFAKLAMKSNGDIIRSKKKKAFVFPCQTCDTQVETQFVSGVLVGKACPNDQKGCQINITETMVKAIEETHKLAEKIAEKEELHESD